MTQVHHIDADGAYLGSTDAVFGAPQPPPPAGAVATASTAPPSMLHRWSDGAWAAPSEAATAASLALRRATFFMALDVALGLTPADPLIEDHIAAIIAASTNLSDAQKRSALTLMSAATVFLRADPDAPGLLDAVGAELGLTSAAIDALFIQADGGETA